jgi:hypothetical protein
MSVEQSVEWELAGKTKVIRENLPQWHFVDHKSQITWPGTEQRLPQWKAMAHDCHCVSDYWTGFGLPIEFIDHFNTQLVITSNYNTIADFHTMNH